MVRQIFKWRAEGISTVQIARRLNDAEILSPYAYFYKIGQIRAERYRDMLWRAEAVGRILARAIYIGHMVQGKTKQSFYEGKRQRRLDESDWIVVHNTHEPFIDEGTFQTVQKIGAQGKREFFERRGKFDHLGQSENILRGLVRCAHCQKPMIRRKETNYGKRLSYRFICRGRANDPARR